MSLKIEQRLDNFFFAENEPRIYTTGAYLVPMRLKNGNQERAVWVVSEFSDDSYLDGRLISPVLYANKVENLIIRDDDN